MTRKTDMYPKPDPRIIGAALALSAVLAFAGWAMLQTPARLTLPPAAPTAAIPTRAAPTAAPAVAATPLPIPTPTEVPPPTEVIDLAPPPPPAEPAPVVEEVPLTPLVFAQGVCAAWHPPQVYPKECP